MIHRITKARFDLYALGTRGALHPHLYEELSFWANEDENLIGAVVYDITDSDYYWVILCRDAIGCFRYCEHDQDIESEGMAQDKLIEALNTKSKNYSGVFVQGEESNRKIDLVTIPPKTKVEKLHRSFRALMSPLYSPAYAAIKEISPWLFNVDPHFVNEFQRYQFDQRVWEMYLWAAFRELNVDVQLLEAPDFGCRVPGFEFTIEATTVAPSMSGALSVQPDRSTEEGQKVFINEYMPIKWGSALTRKLNKKSRKKRYWELPHAQNKPFVLAVADFHDPGEGSKIGSMFSTQESLPLYLYGMNVKVKFDTDNNVVFEPFTIESHSYKDKTAILSGFFNLPDSQNISAVISSNAGTLAKFQRMGVLAGFGQNNHIYIRSGGLFDPDPNALVPIPFRVDITHPSYSEGWADELRIYHNPNATLPLPMQLFPTLDQWFIKDSELYNTRGTNRILFSITNTFVVGSDIND